MFVHFVDRSVRDFVRSTGIEKPSNGRAVDDEAALAAAAAWLSRSIDVCDGRGSSKGYRFVKGWMPPYPETSGYIIPTLLMLGHETGSLPQYALQARALGEWLISIQQPEGGFIGGEAGALSVPDVFDTGMIILGLNALLHETGDPSIRAAACRAGRFLLTTLDRDGCFIRHLSHNILHAYNVRAAWGLLALGRLTGDESFIEGAKRNARWTLGQQNQVGYFGNNAFKKGGNANTHGTAYVMRGLLQIHELTGDAVFLEAVIKAARALQACYAKHGWIAAELGTDWQYLSSHVCLTGYAQLAIIYYRLYQKNMDASYLHTADMLLNDVAQSQLVDDRNKPYFGAIPGSFPIYGRYAPLQYPNWATKFFADALITRRQAHRGTSPLPFQLYSG